MHTTVGQLVELLQDFDPEAPLLLAEQPGYPFEYALRGVALDETTGTVYLVEGTQLNYLSESARDVFENAIGSLDS